MASPPEASLSAVLRDAPVETVSAFVAALTAARGHSVARTAHGFTRDDEPVVVLHETGQPPGECPLDTATDVVVIGDVRAPSVPGTVIEVADLRQQLLYGIDRAQAERLVETHLDCSLAEIVDDATASMLPDEDSSVATPTPGRNQSHVSEGDRTGADSADGGSDPTVTERTDGLPEETADTEQTAGGPGDATAGAGVDTATERDQSMMDAVLTPPRRTRMALVGVVVFAGLVALAGPGLVNWSPAGSTAVGPFAGNDTTPADATGGSGPALAERTLDVDPNALPPGIDPSGEINERRIADVTEAYLTNRSYRLTVTYREFKRGRETAVYTETVRVENESHYTASVMKLGALERGPTEIAGRDVYATPNSTLERRVMSGRARIGRSPSTTPASGFVVDDFERYIRWYLSVDESAVTDERTDGNTTTYRVLSDGDPYPGVTNVTGSSLVRSDGVVTTVRRAYQDPSAPNVRVVVTIRVDDIGSTSAPKPDWAP